MTIEIRKQNEQDAAARVAERREAVRRVDEQIVRAAEFATTCYSFAVPAHKIVL